MKRREFIAFLGGAACVAARSARTASRALAAHRRADEFYRGVLPRSRRRHSFAS